jgi:uncharacterized repeat protein (TIGR01451 family)
MRTLITLTLMFTLTAAGSGALPLQQTPPADEPPPSVGAQAVGTPVLKWKNGGCYSSWCETGWYSSPAVADLDHDGQMEVIAAAYSLFILNGTTGALKNSVAAPTSGARVWPGVVVADLNGDGEKEIVTASGSGYVRVLDHTGSLLWIKRPTSYELRGLSVYDLDGDGHLDVIVTGALGSKTNTWVYDDQGNPRAGWPQLNNGSGYGWGVYNSNAAVGDLDHDGQGKIVVPSDVHYICAYNPDGTQLAANPMYGANTKWGAVGIWEDPAPELRGWGECNGVRSESYRTNFADGPALIADVNADGAAEVIATGNVYDCHAGYPPSKYFGVYLFNADRSRFNTGGYDWRNPPTNTGAPLSEDYNVIESAEPNPALADLDGDGNLEILYASYDGRVHAFWLDKTEHGNWPFQVYPGTRPYRFASEPAIADLDNDGKAEVIFTSWVQQGYTQTGKLYVLNYQGNQLQAVDLPPAFGGPDWNGALPAPTLADIDGDGELEAVVNTAHAGVAAYDLPGTANARILWGTARNNYQRTGSYLQSLKLGVQFAQPVAGSTLTYTLTLRNPGPILYGTRVTDTLPAEGVYLGNVWASAGSAGFNAGLGPSGSVTWAGAVPTGTPVTITFSLQVKTSVTAPTVVTNVALSHDGLGQVWQRTAQVIVNAKTIYLPLSLR